MLWFACLLTQESDASKAVLRINKRLHKNQHKPLREQINITRTISIISLFKCIKCNNQFFIIASVVFKKSEIFEAKFGIHFLHVNATST